jgi:hypothetical protein
MCIIINYYRIVIVFCILHTHSHDYIMQVEFDLIKGPKGLQAANVSGPNGISVKGDPNAPGSNKRINK